MNHRIRPRARFRRRDRGGPGESVQLRQAGLGMTRPPNRPVAETERGGHVVAVAVPHMDGNFRSVRPVPVKRPIGFEDAGILRGQYRVKPLVQFETCKNGELVFAEPARSGDEKTIRAGNLRQHRPGVVQRDGMGRRGGFPGQIVRIRRKGNREPARHRPYDVAPIQGADQRKTWIGAAISAFAAKEIMYFFGGTAGGGGHFPNRRGRHDRGKRPPEEGVVQVDEKNRTAGDFQIGSPAGQWRGFQGGWARVK